VTVLFASFYLKQKSDYITVSLTMLTLSPVPISVNFLSIEKRVKVGRASRKLEGEL
jgi:hypothetical protein